MSDNISLEIATLESAVSESALSPNASSEKTPVENVIETRGLTHYFGARKVIDNINLTVQRGSIFAFLGRNGAGKSTTLRAILGLVEPTRGAAWVLGTSSTRLTPAVRARIGYLTESHFVYGWMNVRECERFQAAFYTHWNRDVFHGVIRHFGLDERTKASNLSRGQRAGLALALTLAPEPELLILDDPALGLDPVARRDLLQSMLYVARRHDRTILFSSHGLADVERVASHVGVLRNGTIKACCTTEKFRENVRQFALHFTDTPPSTPPLRGLLQSWRTDQSLLLTFANLSAEDEAALHDLGASRVEEVPLSLEDAFISYLGERGEKSFFLDNVSDAKTRDEVAK